MSSRAPISAHVTLGTVTKPSLLAEGWTEDRATMKSFNSRHSPCSCSSERGSWFLSNPKSLCNSSWKGTNEGEKMKNHKVCWKRYCLYFKKLLLQYFCKLHELLCIKIIFSIDRSHLFCSKWIIWFSQAKMHRLSSTIEEWFLFTLLGLAIANISSWQIFISTIMLLPFFIYKYSWNSWILMKLKQSYSGGSLIS